MIRYDLGDGCYNISWDNFLSLTHNCDIYYKSHFNTVSDFFEFLDINIKNISRLLFDNCEYILENGKLHNLYDYAKATYIETGILPGWYFSFYIYGKLLYGHYQPNVKICNLTDFNKSNMFTLKYDPVSKKDNIQTFINIDELRKQDIRLKKIKRLLNE